MSTLIQNEAGSIVVDESYNDVLYKLNSNIRNEGSPNYLQLHVNGGRVSVNAATILYIKDRGDDE